MHTQLNSFTQICTKLRWRNKLNSLNWLHKTFLSFLSMFEWETFLCIFYVVYLIFTREVQRITSSLSSRYIDLGWRRHRRNVFPCEMFHPHQADSLELLNLLINWTAGSGSTAKINRPTIFWSWGIKAHLRCLSQISKWAFGCKGKNNSFWRETDWNELAPLAPTFVDLFFYSSCFSFGFFFSQTNFLVSTENGEEKVNFSLPHRPTLVFC